MNVGILAFQGDFAEHRMVLESLGVTVCEVRKKEDLDSVDRLIIPGGESTVISRFLKLEGLDAQIKCRAADGFPVFGTCAGSIVLATKITGGPGPDPLGLIDIDIDRNAYGPQTESFERELGVKGVGRPVKASFIRAPVITRVGKEVDVLAEEKGSPVIVRQGKILAATCHPEMRGETAIHEMFLKI